MRFRWGHQATRYLWYTFRLKSECEAVLICAQYNALTPRPFSATGLVFTVTDFEIIVRYNTTTGYLANT